MSVFPAAPGASNVFVHSAPVSPNQYSNPVFLHRGDPIFIGQDDKIYRSIDGINFALFLNAGTICNAGSLNWLLSDGESVFFAAIDNDTGNSMLYQIDSNLTPLQYPSGHFNETFPEYMHIGFNI